MNSTCDAVRDEARLVAHVQQLLGGLRHHFAAVHRVVVDVHADELFGQRGFHVARELQGVVQRFLVMVERVLDALTHQPACIRTSPRGSRLRSRTFAPSGRGRL